MARAGDRREHPAPSHLQVNCLEDAAIQTRITVLQNLVISCRGPQGKAKVIQNSVGGHVTWTKISSRLFSTMSISTPVLKVILSAVQGHLDRFKDGGLLTAAFSLSLVKSSLRLNVHRRLLIELHEKFVFIVDDYLKCDDCGCKFDVDVFKLDHVMIVLRSLCGPKLSHLGLDVQEKIFAFILDVFLSTIPLHRQDFFSDRVYTQCFENSDIIESTCLKGILVESPELSSLKEQKCSVKRTADAQGTPKIKVALVTESMSGDSDSFVDAVYELDPRVDADSVVVDTLLSLCEGLVQAGVGLILCQRVIHPKVKTFLRQAGVMFVDRLGSLPVPYLRDLTGASPLSVLSTCPENWSRFGWLDDVSHQIWSDKSYLLLTRQNQPIVTLILKSSLEEVLQELKTLSHSAVHTLQLLMREPYVLCGAGCWMTHVGAYLLAKVQENKSSLLQELDCSESQLMTGAENFVSCLQALATGTTSDTKTHLTDLKHHHLWTSDNLHHMMGDVADTRDSACESIESDACNCGLLQSDNVENFEYLTGKSPCFKYLPDMCSYSEKGFPVVVDTLCVVRNAVRIAVVTANTVLSICQYIHDGN